MFNILIQIVLSYLLGSISGSLLMGKFKGGVDIRKLGSGNAGGTNAYRTQGTKFALAVIFIDIIKGFIPSKFISQVIFIHSENLISLEASAVMCGLSAVVGHVYPIYYGFRGGKGAGAAIGMVVAIFPIAIIVGLSTFIVNLILTGWVGLGTILASISIFIYTLFNATSVNIYFVYGTFILSIFIIFTHRSNILRMISGNENRFEKAMFLKKIFNK